MFFIFKMEKYIPLNELNTDNAWVEFTVLNCHDEIEELFYEITLKVFKIKFNLVCVFLAYLVFVFKNDAKLEWKEINNSLAQRTDIYNQTTRLLRRVCLTRHAYYE